MQSRGVKVVHLRVGRESYPDAMGAYWGKEDVIFLEDDKLPTMEDLDELMACPEDACIFPYPFSYRRHTSLKDWLPPAKFPYGAGFVKYSLQRQLDLPFSQWRRDFRNNEFDKIIQVPMIERYGPIHIHPRMIQHNHPPTKRELVGDVVLRYMVPGRKMPRFMQRFR